MGEPSFLGHYLSSPWPQTPQVPQRIHNTHTEKVIFLMGAWYRKSRATGLVQSHKVHRGDRKLVCRSSLGASIAMGPGSWPPASSAAPIPPQETRLTVAAVGPQTESARPGGSGPASGQGK